VADQLLSLWNRSPMPPVGIPPQPTRSIPGMPSGYHYLPAEYAATPGFNQRPRLPHHGGGGNQHYSGWVQPPFSQWGMMGSQRHGYPGPFPQDFPQHQFGGYSLLQQMPKNYSVGSGGGMYPSGSGHHQQPASTNPSVMILQRSGASSESSSSAGK